MAGRGVGTAGPGAVGADRLLLWTHRYRILLWIRRPGAGDA
jgi:hypothetical protein